MRAPKPSITYFSRIKDKYHLDDHVYSFDDTLQTLAPHAAGSGHASNAGDDVSLPGRNSSLGQDDFEPKNEMERRINLRSKALQRGLPKYV
jgi:hypothetical protein